MSNLPPYLLFKGVSIGDELSYRMRMVIYHERVDGNLHVWRQFIRSNLAPQQGFIERSGQDGNI